MEIVQLVNYMTMKLNNVHSKNVKSNTIDFDIEVGKCNTCKHRWCDYFNLNEVGIYGCPENITNSGCLLEIEMLQKYPDCEIIGYGKDIICPLWELSLY